MSCDSMASAKLCPQVKRELRDDDAVATEEAGHAYIGKRICYRQGPQHLPGYPLY